MLLKECSELLWVVHLLQAADVWSPVQDLSHDAWPSLLPADAPLGAGAVQLICMLVSLQEIALSNLPCSSYRATRLAAFSASSASQRSVGQEPLLSIVLWAQRHTRRSARMLYDMMRMLWPPSDMCTGLVCKHSLHCHVLYRTLNVSRPYKAMQRMYRWLCEDRLPRSRSRGAH